MRENEPVLLVLSVCDRGIILEKDEILSEKRHSGGRIETGVQRAQQSVSSQRRARPLCLSCWLGNRHGVMGS
jgi:hypothetical protein